MINKTKSESDSSRSALFLSSGPSQHNDNFKRIPDAFAAAGWHTTTVPHESLLYVDGEVHAWTASSPEHARLTDFDLIWPIGFGNFDTFLDRAQLLRLVPQSMLITQMSAWFEAHGKSAFLAHCPVSAVASCSEPLIEMMQREGGEWVLKPNAGSFGRDVHFIPEGQQGRDLVRSVLSSQRESFYILQRFLPQIVQGETRTLIADGQVIGSYLRTPSHDIRANVALNATVGPTDLRDGAGQLVAELCAQLVDQGIGFAAIDTVDVHLIEVNIANPGGLSTLSEIYQHDFASDLVQAICNRRFKNQPSRRSS